MKRPALVVSMVLHGTLIASAVAMTVGGEVRGHASIRIEPFEMAEAFRVEADSPPPPAEAAPLPDDCPLVEEPEVEPPRSALTEPPPPRHEVHDPFFETEPPTAASTWLHELARLPQPQVLPRQPQPTGPPVPATTAPRPVSVVPGKNPPPTYPRLARRRGWTGEVLLEVGVDAANKPISCRILLSSGHPILDRAARTSVLAWGFQDGPGRVQIPIRFVLR